MAKLNVDGAFSPDGRAGCGMLLRNQRGEVLFAACRQVQHCQDATEAEIMAIEEGVKLALNWTSQEFIVESDCSVAIELIDNATKDRSAYAFSINIVRELLRERNSKLIKISREANVASHELAQLAKVKGVSNLWLGVAPPEIATVIAKDCNFVSD
jgi:ribonuclease HI